MKDYDVIDGICGDFTDKARVCFDKGYKQGYKDGYKQAGEDFIADGEKAYQKGLNDAWEAARKIADMPSDVMVEIFGYCDPIYNNSASEAIAKIKEYEDSQKCKTCKYYGHALDDVVGTDVCYGCVNNKMYKEKQTDDEIRVGDEVKGKFDKEHGIVIECDDEQKHFAILCSDGQIRHSYVDDITKTGRHFSQIEDVLAQMKEDK